MNDRIISLTDWFQTAPGRYLLDWEQRQFDLAVSDLFGYNALQRGNKDVLNKMHRFAHQLHAYFLTGAAPKSSKIVVPLKEAK